MNSMLRSVSTWQMQMGPWTVAMLATLACVTTYRIKLWLIPNICRKNNVAQSPQASSPHQYLDIFGLCIPVLQTLAIAQLQNFNASTRTSSDATFLTPCFPRLLQAECWNYAYNHPTSRFWPLGVVDISQGQWINKKKGINALKIKFMFPNSVMYGSLMMGWALPRFPIKVASLLKILK